jgi:acyl-CoA thioesterase-1
MFGTTRVYAGLCAAMIIAASGCAGKSPVSPSNSPFSTKQVVVLGDSLAVSPTKEQSFPAVLQGRIQEAGLRWTMVNAGVAGDTSTAALGRLDAVLTSDVGVMVLEIGANDGLRGSALGALEQNLSATIERAQTRGISVLLCGMETPPLHGLDYSLEFHGIFPRLAARYATPLVPFLLTGVVLDPSLNGSDLIHPNAAGARRIADTVWPYLEPLLNKNIQNRSGLN